MGHGSLLKIPKTLLGSWPFYPFMTSYLFLMVTLNLVRIGFLTQVACFIYVIVEIYFLQYEIVFTCVVVTRNNVSCRIVGIRTILIKIFDEVFRTLGNARHFLYSERNMIFFSTLDAKGNKYTVVGRVLQISKGARIAIKGDRRSTKLCVAELCCYK